MDNKNRLISDSSQDSFGNVRQSLSRSSVASTLIKKYELDRELESSTWPVPNSVRIITLSNQKGGVGKTTTTVNLAVAYAMHGANVLVIDLDPQGNASTALNIPHLQGTPSIYESLIENAPLEQVVQKSPTIDGLYCVPSTIDLAGADIELVAMPDREMLLAKKIKDFLSVLKNGMRAGGYAQDKVSLPEKFDYIFIDCPPSLGLLVLNALVASSEVFIPIQAEYYALEGLSQLISTIRLVKKSLNSDLSISNILVTMSDSRTLLSKEVYEEVKLHFKDLVIDTVIPRAVKISEAPSHNMSILEYAPHSSGAVSYKKIAYDIAVKYAESVQEEGNARAENGIYAARNEEDRISGMGNEANRIHVTANEENRIHAVENEENGISATGNEESRISTAGNEINRIPDAIKNDDSNKNEYETGTGGSNDTDMSNDIDRLDAIAKMLSEGLK